MAENNIDSANPAQPILPQDSATTKAENIERNGAAITGADIVEPSSPRKRAKPDTVENEPEVPAKRQKGVAPIKSEFLLRPTGNKVEVQRSGAADDDAAEAADDRYQKTDARDSRNNKKNWKDKKKEKKQTGQNTSRKFGSSHDKLKLCNTRALSPEFSPKECPFGEKCRMEHDLRKYLTQGRREDLTTFGGACPVYEVRGMCPLGWKCRFHKSHSEERETEDGRKELVLLENAELKEKAEKEAGPEGEVGVANIVPKLEKINLSRRRTETPKSDAYIQWTNSVMDAERKYYDRKPEEKEADQELEDRRAEYLEPPFRPSEKRRLYYGPETPVLAPLTTQGNLPFRRLCVELGAQVTWSEMAMGLPLLQGEKGEWALMKAHESEVRAPRVLEKNTVVRGYDNSKDLKFGAQIAANKPWLATKVVEVLTALCPSLRAIDLNCGCPINLVCEGGSGSALLDQPSKLENTLRGMNYVSGETPITVKIRMGTKDGYPTADKLVKRLVLGGFEAVESGKGASGVAAITLHGRSKQQRYTRSADWSYIAECAALINRLKREKSAQTDTIREADARDLANEGHVYFCGNGDCYSHVDYYNAIDNAKVDSVMVARGALIKPWIFEEIEKGQYLDKSATERLAYVEKFAKYGLQTWGSDELGIGTTRRFLLEWLSFSCRYVPIGLLEHLPPNIQDRAPSFKGRNELETLMSSDNYKDWIKISEMFLGPAHPDFRFEPKHKSNAYQDIEAEG
ncbi:putative tRNA-dihydrouridine(47) synthase [NAD(P)(+)] [Aaosphaeria arxii CBS 175.79]|uniref:tRNA-dihydrouridine(47) synthase [NAD(P)(+)] n=1 Tax=Aaosphaeria arxii CBS 175.79 TaxID=1450172 RepID=A0A6A5XWQ6_9PLEO|nr:putative tRNA-dihydrouridine(47) synthase [NAD(P)(+)] [Aaosphaeria arxii CBS 175.79]KAF2017592.1 putative tRNA-dihydrouridine(47) synthase [NAD(P)(+)] [Aaosphaeria arxii CBS 175.79]